MLLLLLSLGLSAQVALAASDGWTPIIPESGGGGSGRHAGAGLGLGLGLGLGPGAGPLAVEPGLPGVLASLSGFHSHAYRPPRPAPPAQHEHADTCALYKAAMTQDLYFQYIQYKVHMPDLKEFTLCMWHKFYNHSSDHPLFSYATRDTPRAVLSWVSATDRSTYFSMAVDGHTLYRLNYPLRLNRWYHSCQSWNGRTGEWQVWVNAERVGRGFHNLLVNHVVKGGGVTITGQEQRQFGGGFLEGEGAPKGSGGMLGEVTQLFFYSVALTAGKAYRDHKHHHGNYNSDVSHQQPRSTTTTTTTPQPETSTMGPYAPFITNGQLTPQLPIFELSAFRKNIPMPPEQSPLPTAAAAMLDFSSLLAGPGPAVSYLHMTPTGGSPVHIPLLAHTRPALDLDPQQHYLFKRDHSAKGTEKESSAAPGTDSDAKASGAVKRKAPADENTSSTSQVKKVKREARVDKDSDEEAAAMQAAEVEPQRITKRQPGQQADDAGKREAKRDKDASKGEPQQSKRELSTINAPTPAAEDADGEASSQQDKKKKRQTLSLHGGPVDLGGDVDTSLLSQGLSGLLPHGETLGTASYSPPLTSYFEFHGNHQQLLTGPSMGFVTGLAAGPAKAPPPLKKETEPAEGEVIAVMNVCSGCSPDPFAKVNVISWQGTPKKLYSGVLYLPAKPMCRKF